jgi:type I restriction enzyme S subunit
MKRITTKTIEELTDTLIDYRGKTPEKTSSGVKLITAKVIKGGFILDGDHEYIDEAAYDAWMRRGLPKQWDILITTEAPLGEVAQLRGQERVALAQRVILLRGKPDLIDQGYYFQALKSPFAQAELNARATGTTVLGIKQSELRQVRIPYYPLPTQRKIATILSAYDDLIENNTRRIAILEEMVQAIYREWFVEFRFPGHEKVKMVESPLGKTPAGWKPTVLDDLAEEVRRGVDPSEVDPETPYFGLEHLPRKSIALNEWGTARDVQSTKLAFKRGEILFGKIRPYFHKVGVAPVDGVCSSDAIVIVPKEQEFFPAVLCCVSSKAFVDHATQTSQGTKMPRANWGVLVKYPLPLPPCPLLEEFNAFINDIVDEVRNLIFKNRNLRATRDFLLPKLISGQIDVEDMDIAVGESNGDDAVPPATKQEPRKRASR